MMTESNLWQLLIQQLNRIEKQIADMDQRIDASFETLGQRVSAVEHEQLKHAGIIKAAHWVMAGVGSIVTLGVAIWAVVHK